MCFLIIFIFVFCLFLKVSEREKSIKLGGKGGGEDLGGIRREKHHQIMGYEKKSAEPEPWHTRWSPAQVKVFQ